MSSRPLRPLILSLGLLAAVSLALSGCGRKGDLDVPSTPVEKLNKRGVDSKPPVKDRPFILDPLL
jgi:predicted small lipoprotein YifL